MGTVASIMADTLYSRRILGKSPGAPVHAENAGVPQTLTTLKFQCYASACSMQGHLFKPTACHKGAPLSSSTVQQAGNVFDQATLIYTHFGHCISQSQAPNTVDLHHSLGFRHRKSAPPYRESERKSGREWWSLSSATAVLILEVSPS